LQGFPDKWGRPNWISEDTRGEVAEFWHEVYMTDCTIKGKKPKPIIAEKRSGWEVAVIRWHNRLHADSAEYKMWGNGIALPCALYVMQGIEDALKEESKWTS
jgi:DNA (cytosine-5)-methyltransferase 1